ncbi:MAG: hypothetical protein IJW82_06955 [Clostridia bacterium]|nr:hypothetical protein [Clostridia bacterium]
MKETIKEALDNDGKIFKLKPDVFKKMTEEEKQNHTKYAKLSIALSIFDFVLSLLALMFIAFAQDFGDKLWGIAFIFIVIGNTFQSITYAMSELQINKLKISKVAYILAFAIIIPCAIICFIALTKLFA